MPRVAAVLAAFAALSGCQGERPPIWDLYGDPAAQMPAVTGNAVIYDQTVTAYTWPDVGFWMGGPPRGYYPPYPAYPYGGRYWWYRNPAWGGQPPMLWRNPAAPKAFGIRPAVPGPQTLPPSPSPPTLSPAPAPLLAPPAAPPVPTPRVTPPVPVSPVPSAGIPAPPAIPGR